MPSSNTYRYGPRARQPLRLTGPIAEILLRKWFFSEKSLTEEEIIILQNYVNRSPTIRPFIKELINRL